MRSLTTFCLVLALAVTVVAAAMQRDASAQQRNVARVAIAPVHLTTPANEELLALSTAVHEAIAAYVDCFYAFERVPTGAVHAALIPFDLAGGLSNETAAELGRAVDAQYVIVTTLDVSLSGLNAQADWVAVADASVPQRVTQRCDIADPWANLTTFAKYVALALRDDPRYPRGDAEKIRGVEPMCGLYVSTALEIAQARLALWRNAPGDAIDHANNALEMEPTATRALELLASATAKALEAGDIGAGEIPGTIDRVLGGLEHSPYNAHLHLYAGKLCLAAADAAESDEEASLNRAAAKEQFEKALALHPRMIAAHRKLTLDLAGGLEAAERARARLGDDHAEATLLVVTTMAVQDPEAARELARAARRNNRDHAGLLIAYTSLAALTGQTSGAINTLRTACRANPYHARMQLAYFEALYMRDASAADTMEQALVAFALVGKDRSTKLEDCLFGRGALDVKAIARKAELKPLDPVQSLVMWGIYAHYVDSNELARPHAERFVELGGNAAVVLAWLQPWREPVRRFTRTVDLEGGPWVEDE